MKSGHTFGLLAVKAGITWLLSSDTYMQKTRAQSADRASRTSSKKWRCKICKFLTRENFQNFLSRTFQTFPLYTIAPKEAIHQRKKAIQ